MEIIMNNIPSTCGRYEFINLIWSKKRPVKFEWVNINVLKRNHDKLKACLKRYALLFSMCCTFRSSVFSNQFFPQIYALWPLMEMLHLFLLLFFSYSKRKVIVDWKYMFLVHFVQTQSTILFHKHFARLNFGEQRQFSTLLCIVQICQALNNNLSEWFCFVCLLSQHTAEQQCIFLSLR